MKPKILSQKFSDLLKIMTSNVSNAGLGFLASILFAKYLTVEDFSIFAEVNNYALILVTFFELGLPVFIVAFSRYSKAIYSIGVFYWACSTIAFLFLAILLTTYLGINEYLVLTTALASVMALFKLTAAKYQSLAMWSKFSILNSMFSLSKFITAFILLLSFELLSIEMSVRYIFVLLILICLLPLLPVLKKVKTHRKITLKKLKWCYKKGSPYASINVVITLAMRADLMIAGMLLSANEIASYAVSIQLAFVFPLITNTLLSYYLKESHYDEVVLPGVKTLFIKLIKFLGIIIPIAYLFFLFFEIVLFDNKFGSIAIIASVLSVAYCGGVIFTPFEAILYKKNAKAILQLKVCQMLIIIILSGILGGVLSTMGIALAVVISRFYGWFFIARKIHAN